jgi:hypothetical protein
VDGCVVALGLGPQTWPALIGTDTVQAIGVERALFAVVCLGHLIRYGQDNGALRLTCARFAGHLILGAFGASLGHPQRAVDFAVYTPKALVPGNDVFADPRCCTPAWVMFACRGVALTLLQHDAEHAHLALPVLSLYEHVATYATASVRCEVHASLRRFVCVDAPRRTHTPTPTHHHRHLPPQAPARPLLGWDSHRAFSALFPCVCAFAGV